jgi:hypothetical protein
MAFYQNLIKGGKGAQAGDMRVEQRLNEAGVGNAPPPPAPDPNASKMVDPATGIRFANGGKIGGFPGNFEQNAKDVEKSGMREGSRREEAMDRKQAAKIPNPPIKPFGTKPGATPA